MYCQPPDPVGFVRHISLVLTLRAGKAKLRLSQVAHTLTATVAVPPNCADWGSRTGAAAPISALRPPP
jgi:hypothetical protein